MNRDVVIDTHIFESILEEYNSRDEFAQLSLQLMRQHIAYEINKVIKYRGEYGYVVVSSLAIIEIANQFRYICDNNSNIDYTKFRAFVNQPPSWLLIEPISIDVISLLNMLDTHVLLKGELKPIEINDAIHVATTLIRNDEAVLATNDARISLLPILKNRTL
jgi:hypothetical protein